MNTNIKFFSYLVCFLPAALITGPFLSDLIVTVCAISFLAYSFLNNKLSYFNNTFFKFFIIFWLYIIFNSFFATEILVSLKVTIPYLRFAIFTILIIYLIDNDKNFIVRFSKILIITFSIVLFDSFFQYIFGFNILGLEPPKADRLSSFFGEEMIVGSFLSRLFPLVLFSVLILSQKYNKNIKYLGALFLILTDIIIFLSGERTSFGILLIINIGFIILINQMKWIRVFSFAVSIVLIIVISSSNSVVKNRMIDQTIKDFGIKENNLKSFSHIHQDHYNTSLNMFKSKPLSGIGVKMFRYECHKEQYRVGKWNCTSHPHHMHLQLLSETGLIGYSFLVIILFFLIKNFLVTIYQNYLTKEKSTIIYDIRNCILIGIFANVFPFLPSGNVFNNWLSIIYFLPIGFYSVKKIVHGN